MIDDGRIFLVTRMEGADPVAFSTEADAERFVYNNVDETDDLSIEDVTLNPDWEEKPLGWRAMWHPDYGRVDWHSVTDDDVGGQYGIWVVAYSLVSHDDAKNKAMRLGWIGSEEGCPEEVAVSVTAVDNGYLAVAKREDGITASAVSGISKEDAMRKAAYSAGAEPNCELVRVERKDFV